MKAIRNTLQFAREYFNKVISWKGTPYLTLLIISNLLLFPIYWTFVTSFKSTAEIHQWPPTLFPQNFTLTHYRTALMQSPVPINLLNSAIYSLAVTAFVIIVGTLTTYGFSIYPYKGSRGVILTFLATRIVPPQSLWLPFIIFWTRLGLMNSRPGVIIFEIVLIYPLSIWLLKGIFDRFPRELIDAAAIDGASRLRTLLRVVVPVVAPGIGAIGIISFLWTWQAFMFPFLILNNPDLYPATVGIYNFIGDLGIQWGPLTATGVLTILPGLIFFIFAQRYILEGLAEGATK